MYISYVLPIGYSYVFVFISLLPHMLPVCTRWCRRVSRKINSLEFPHRHQFRIRASLRILNSLELRSSWSTKCTLGTRGRFLACGGNFRRWPKADTSSAVGRSHDRRTNCGILRRNTGPYEYKLLFVTKCCGQSKCPWLTSATWQKSLWMGLTHF